MKKIKFFNLIAIMAIIFMGPACSDDDDVVVINNVKVALSYPDGIEIKEGVIIKARTNGTGTEYEMKTDNSGSVMFKLPVGNYEFTASDTRTKGGKLTAYNSLLSKVIDKAWDEASILKLEMEGSTKSQLIIKELYIGGCPTDDGSDTYSYGQYITLYNNSTEKVDLKNLCFGYVSSNSHAMGVMSEINEGDTDAYWFKEDWTPAAFGYFYFQNETFLEPGKEMVVAMSGGIDHTQTHNLSVDLSKSDYYVWFDSEVYGKKQWFPSPSANIDVSHYLKAVKYSYSSAPVITISCPAIFLFYPEGQTAKEYANDRTDDDHWMGLDIFPRKKVPSSWTIDAIEGFTNGKESDNKKRLNPKIDAGHIYTIGGKGYTLYRNVDKETTEAIEGNKDKLVYSYSMGTDQIETKHGSTDPSGIDAEASIANGAAIIFKDTNNSGNDFHLRKKSSLRK